MSGPTRTNPQQPDSPPLTGYALIEAEQPALYAAAARERRLRRLAAERASAGS